MLAFEKELVPTTTTAEIAAVGKAFGIPEKYIKKLCRVARDYVFGYGYKVYATQVADGEFRIYTNAGEIIAVKYV